MTKGRSPAFALNFILRKKAAACLSSFTKLFLPWVESNRMPAEALSCNVLSRDV